MKCVKCGRENFARVCGVCAGDLPEAPAAPDAARLGLCPKPSADPGFSVSFETTYPETWAMTCGECKHVGVFALERKTYGCAGCGATYSLEMVEVEGCLEG